MFDDLINIRDVNFDDIDDVMGSAHLIFTLANEEGIVMGAKNRQSKKGAKIILMAQHWLNIIKPKIPTLPPASKLKVRMPYEFMHVVAYQEAPDGKFMTKMLLDIFDARIHGDHTISEYTLYDAIERELRCKNKAFEGKPLTWTSYTLVEWWENENKRLKLSDHDTLCQAAMLLKEDLFVMEQNPAAFKEKVFNTHRHYLDEYEGMDLKTLHALNFFLAHSLQFLDMPDYERYDALIKSAIINHPAINRYYRQSLQLQQSL